MTNARTKRLIAGAIWIVALAAGTRTQAQGIALDRFQPAPAGDRFFGVQGGDPGGHLSPRLMLLGDYAYKPLVLYRASDDQEVGSVVKNQLVLHVAAGISLWDRLWVFASMPLSLYTNGQSPSDISSPSGAAAGDLRAGLRLRLLGENRSLASLSLAGYVFIPTGSKDKYTSTGEVHGMPALVLSGEGDSFAYAVNAGVDVQKKSNGSTSVILAPALGSELTFGAAIGLLLADGMLQIGIRLKANSHASFANWRFRASSIRSWRSALAGWAARSRSSHFCSKPERYWADSCGCPR